MSKKHPDIKVLKVDYHRNGVCGDGFHVALLDFKEAGEKKRRMVAIRFPGECRCAVLDTALLAKDTIEFMQNSWRGDHFVEAVDAAIEAEVVRQTAAASRATP